MIGKRVSMLVVMSLAFVGVSALDASAETVKRPILAVVGSSVHITKNCEQGQTALTAAVRIKNSGGPLAAGTMKLRIAAFVAGGFEMAEALLPAIGAGQEQTVHVEVKSLRPPSQLVGIHRFQVFLMSTSTARRALRDRVSGVAPYELSAVFPGGHCGGMALVPRAELRGLPPSAVGRPLVDPRGLDTSARPPLSSCPDLAVTRIDAVVESRRPSNYGDSDSIDVKIEAVVKNIGFSPFEARNRETKVWMFTPDGLPNMPAYYLGPGQEMTLVHRIWRNSGEMFNVRVQIFNNESSDNPRGVECRMDNNELHRTFTLR